MRRVILTGTACSGKSVLPEVLRERGFKTVPEAETQIVNELVRMHGAEAVRAWINPNYFKFKTMVGENQKRLEEEASLLAAQDDFVIFDRSAICYIAYCHLRDSPIPPILETLAEQTEAVYVFFLEMLHTFGERREQGRVMTRVEAESLSYLVETEYTRRGFELIRVPEISREKEPNIIARADLISSYLK